MIIQAELRRKQSEYEGEACSVDKVIELPAQRFKQFTATSWKRSIIATACGATRPLEITMVTSPLTI